jgi:head-tail adaptor
MNTGTLNKTITIHTLTRTVTAGDASESWSAGDTVRASVRQIDGTRYLKAEELIDREVYEIMTWNNSYGNNLKITYGSKTLYPLRPPTINQDASTREIIKIIAATKG